MSTDREGEHAERQEKRQRGVAKVTAEASQCKLNTHTHSTNAAPSSLSSPSLSVVNSSVIFPPLLSSPLRSSLAPLYSNSNSSSSSSWRPSSSSSSSNSCRCSSSSSSSTCSTCSGRACSRCPGPLPAKPPCPDRRCPRKVRGRGGPREKGRRSIGRGCVDLEHVTCNTYGHMLPVFCQQCLPLCFCHHLDVFHSPFLLSDFYRASPSLSCPIPLLSFCPACLCFSHWYAPVPPLCYL